MTLANRNPSRRQKLSQPLRFMQVTRLVSMCFSYQRPHPPPDAIGIDTVHDTFGIAALSQTVARFKMPLEPSDPRGHLMSEAIQIVISKLWNVYLKPYLF
jgi:hypothetical protein